MDPGRSSRSQEALALCRALLGAVLGSGRPSEPLGQHAMGTVSLWPGGRVDFRGPGTHLATVPRDRVGWGSKHASSRAPDNSGRGREPQRATTCGSDPPTMPQEQCGPQGQLPALTLKAGSPAQSSCACFPNYGLSRHVQHPEKTTSKLSRVRYPINSVSCKTLEVTQL